MLDNLGLLVSVPSYAVACPFIVFGTCLRLTTELSQFLLSPQETVGPTDTYLYVVLAVLLLLVLYSAESNLQGFLRRPAIEALILGPRFVLQSLSRRAGQATRVAAGPSIEPIILRFSVFTRTRGFSRGNVLEVPCSLSGLPVFESSGRVRLLSPPAAAWTWTNFNSN